MTTNGSLHHTSIRNRFRGDILILYLFAAYGLAAGIVTYIGSLSSDYGDLFSLISLLMNYPANIVIIAMEWFVANPSGLSLYGFYTPLTLIIGSAAVWSVIGFIMFSIVRVFRLASRAHPETR